MPQIELKEISKTFKVRERPQGKYSKLKGAFVRNTKVIKALDDVSFTIDEGELFGYIGPNGAGKSTSVKVMSGILVPDSGECKIMGREPWKNRINYVAQIGVVFGQRSQLWWDIPVSDTFSLLRDIYDIPANAFRERLCTLSEALDIGSLLETPVRQLSLGQRMRCEVAAALLHRPKILFLDEPTIGLDAVSKLALRDFLREENRQNGVTMILTTHDMNDIEALCEKVMVIGHGRVLFSGALSVLKKQYSPLRTVRAVCSSTCELYGIEGAEKTELKNNEWTVYFNPETTPAHKIVAQLAQKLELSDIMIQEQDIDEMIASMYREMQL